MCFLERLFNRLNCSLHEPVQLRKMGAGGDVVEVPLVGKVLETWSGIFRAVVCVKFLGYTVMSEDFLYSVYDG